MFLTTTDLLVVDLDVVHGAVVDEVRHVAEGDGLDAAHVI